MATQRLHIKPPADTHQWGWCWARCVVRPRRCSSGSGCWGAAGPRRPAAPDAPECWRGTGSCQSRHNSDRCGSETNRHPGSLLWTAAGRKHIHSFYIQNMIYNKVLKFYWMNDKKNWSDGELDYFVFSISNKSINLCSLFNYPWHKTHTDKQCEDKNPQMLRTYCQCAEISRF